MSIKDLKSKTANVQARPVETRVDVEAKTAPVRQYDVTQRMHEAEKQVVELKKLLEDEQNARTEERQRLLENTASIEVPLSALVHVSGRKRNLTNQQFEELVENLKQNPLVTPISVRAAGTGKYEIISGHNRVKAFEKLNRTKIPAVVLEDGPVQADLNAFYANLFQPDLPDYEKYLGFCMMKRHLPDLTHEEIADKAGVSRSQVTKLMAFSSLPIDALKVLQEAPRALGANAAVELAAAANAGKHDLVVHAIHRLASGEIDQTTAVAQVAQPTATNQVEKAKKPKIEPRVIKRGKATYCSVRRVEKTIRLDFKSPEEAAVLEQAIFDLIESLAKQGQSKE